jgi:hypothetical protein
MDALAAGHDAAVQMIDTSVVRVHRHGACIADKTTKTWVAHEGPDERSRAGGRQWLACATRPHRKSPKSGSGCLARRHRSRRNRFCLSLALKLLFRQAQPIFRLGHPERSVSRLTLCELSA